MNSKPTLLSLILITALLSACGGQTPSTATEAPTAQIAATPQDALPQITETPAITPTASVETATPDPTSIRLSGNTEIVESVPNVTLDVELHYAERWMKVHQRVEMTNASQDEWTEIVFNIPINAVLNAFYLDFLDVTQGSEVQSGTPPLAARQTVMRIPLLRPAQSGESLTIDMDYRVLIPPVAPTDWPPIGTTGWTFDVIQAGEWYPALVPYVEGQGWHTWEYRPVGDPTVYPLTNYALNVTTDEPLTIASGGPLGQDENGVWRFSMNAARGIAFLASNRFKMLQGESNGITITSYYRAEHEMGGQAAIDMAANSIKLFEELYGPYPYDGLIIAENGFFGGMEYSGLISISDYAYASYVGQTPSLLGVLIAHETAHQWWYGAVGNDQANEPWLDESLGFYSEFLYVERYHPNSTSWWWENRVNIYEPHGPVDATIYSYDNAASFITSMYGQAARFIHDLRTQMGDDAFFTFLQDYYATYRGKIVTAQDFKSMAQAHTDKDLMPLFEAYFANP